MFDQPHIVLIRYNLTHCILKVSFHAHASLVKAEILSMAIIFQVYEISRALDILLALLFFFCCI